MQRTKFSVNRHHPVLLGSPIFKDIPGDDLMKLLACLEGVVLAFDKHEVIYPEGATTTKIGVILEGMVDTVQDDFWGNQVLLGRFHAGQCFAESFVLARADALPFSAVSATPSIILAIPYEHTFKTCVNACKCHTQFFDNLLYIAARKNIGLIKKIHLLTRHSVREKVLAYLWAEAKKAGSQRFTIPFNRQGLANYLAMDRSTLSSELNKLRREGVISFEKNTVEIRHMGDADAYTQA